MSKSKRKLGLEELEPQHLKFNSKQAIKEAEKVLEKAKKMQNGAPIMLRKGDCQFIREIKRKQEKQG